MLSELKIKNLAIIDEIAATFTDGLNIISGETGAGKSIIIGAVNLLLGDRASADLVRSSEDAAEVEALFHIGGSDAVREELARMGLDCGDELILKRHVSRTGRNRVYINGSMATLSMLATLSEHLVNICGQHEHQIMLDAGHHIDILDEFGGLRGERASYTALFETYRDMRVRHDEMERISQERSEREDLLRFQLRELEDARLTPGEDMALLEEKKILANARKLEEHAASAYDILYGEEGSVLERMNRVATLVREIRKIDPSLAVSEEHMESTLANLDDAALQFRDYMKRIVSDPARLEEVDGRLELIGRLKRKYGGTIEAILLKKNEMETSLKQIATLDEEIRTLLREIESIECALREKASALSGARKRAAAKLEGAIVKELRAMKMQQSAFSVRFADTRENTSVPTLHEKGFDDVEFYMSTNVGEEMKPMNRIASGGELSRIMLAVKKVLARTGSVGTVVFDEVDSGIGGAVAEVVGRKLKDIAAHHQVLCITHLPQIACFGDAHFLVAKDVVGKRTKVQIHPLADEERLGEITRMLGGVTVTEATREYAAQMLKSSRCAKG